MKLREAVPQKIRHSVAWFLFGRSETLLNNAGSRPIGSGRPQQIIR
jgi:hypothetical protein